VRLLLEAAEHLGFTGPVVVRKTGALLTPYLQAFGREFGVYVEDGKGVLTGTLLRDGKRLASKIRSLADLGRVLAQDEAAESLPVPSGEVVALSAAVLPRTVQVLPLRGILHAVAWATRENAECVFVEMEGDALIALRAELSAWLCDEQHDTPLHILHCIPQYRAA